MYWLQKKLAPAIGVIIYYCRRFGRQNHVICVEMSSARKMNEINKRRAEESSVIGRPHAGERPRPIGEIAGKWETPFKFSRQFRLAIE